MIELLEISSSTLYGKIDFIYKQCRLLAASREAQLPYSSYGRLRLCTDQQTYLVNWSDRRARRHILIPGVATAEADSGYVLGLSPAYDMEADLSVMEAAREACGDTLRPPAMRDFARCWSGDEYRRGAALWRAQQAKKDKDPNSAEAVAPVDLREDIEAALPLTDSEQLPKTGALVHSEYTVHGHFHFLKHLLRGARRIQFHMDDEAALLMACVGAFVDRIDEAKVEVRRWIRFTHPVRQVVDIIESKRGDNKFGDQPQAPILRARLARVS